MKRRIFVIAMIVFSVALPAAARADFVDDLVTVLEGQGYSDIDVMRTLLGRARIMASNAQGTRELVVNPRTGEVLRDVWVNNAGIAKPPALSASSRGDDNSGRRGSGRDEDDDRDDDDHDDDDRDSGHDSDDDDDDSSGHGSDHDDDD